MFYQNPPGVDSVAVLESSVCDAVNEDCIEVLESYAGNILYSSENDELDIAKLEKILSQPAVKSLISDLSSAATYSLFAEHIKN